MSSAVEKWSSLRDDPRHEMAREALEEGDYDTALEIWGNLLDDTAKERGETSTWTGFFYYFYGTTLLCKAEDNSSLFGEAVNQAAEAEAKRQCKEAANELTQAVAGGSAPDGEEAKTLEAQPGVSEASKGQDDNVTGGDLQEESGPAGTAKEDEGQQEEAEQGEKPLAGQDDDAAAPDEEGGEEDGDDEEEDDEDEDDGDEDEDEEAEEGGEDDNKQIDAIKEQVLEDLEIAWENLEAARTIFEKEKEDSEALMMLGRVHGKLGDLQKMNGNHLEAIVDYKKALNILEAAPAVTDAAAQLSSRRRIADFYNSLAVCLLSVKSEVERNPEATKSSETTAENLEGECVKAYETCRDVLQSAIPLATTAEQQEELRELVDEFSETIESLTGEEAKLLELERKSAPQTTIGFKSESAPASFNASAFGTSSFGSSSFGSVSEDSKQPAVNVLSVKRKNQDGVKPVDKKTKVCE